MYVSVFVKALTLVVRFCLFVLLSVYLSRSFLICLCFTPMDSLSLFNKELYLNTAVVLQAYVSHSLNL